MNIWAPVVAALIGGLCALLGQNIAAARNRESVLLKIIEERRRHLTHLHIESISEMLRCSTSISYYFIRMKDAITRNLLEHRYDAIADEYIALQTEMQRHMLFIPEALRPRAIELLNLSNANIIMDQNGIDGEKLKLINKAMAIARADFMKESSSWIKKELGHA